MTDTKPCPFCGEEIKAIAKKCRYCLEFLDGYSRESIWNEINTGGGAAIGNDVNAGSFVGRDQYNAPVTLGKAQRDEQYEIVLNWEKLGKPPLREFDLANRDLSDLKLAGADLRKANLQGADLYGSNLSGAYLIMANLSEAYLIMANLTGADLSGVNLSRANLSRADLSEANLTMANLSGAHLIRADLSEANLLMANLRGADLSDAKLLNVFLTGVKDDQQTYWPEGFDLVAAGLFW